jgi:propanol-preferring alcohol dehydrogenase
LRAARFQGVDRPIEFVDVPPPVTKPGWVIVDVHAVGMCHSDVHILNGPGAAWLSKTPITLGHEVAGVIAGLGEGVEGFSVGDRVGVCATPGPDEHTRPFGPGTDLGPDGGSQPGVHVDGGYAEQCLVRASRLVPIPDGVSFELAAVGTDALVAGYHNVRNVAEVKLGERVGVVGLGGLGMSGLRTAVLAGAEVYGVDVREQVFEDAYANGATQCFTSVGDLKALEPDVILDFAGVGTTTNEAVKAVRARGRVVLVGLGKPEMTIETTPFVISRIKLLTSQGVRKEDLVQVYRLLERGLLTPRLEEFDFEDIPGALERLHTGKVTGRLFTRPQRKD